MIQPVSPYSPGANCKGISLKPVSQGARAFEKKLAVVNAGGMSAAAAVLTTVIARSYTATWKNAGLFGVGAGLITMMFLCPRNLYKAGIYTFKDTKH